MTSPVASGALLLRQLSPFARSMWRPAVGALTSIGYTPSTSVTPVSLATLRCSMATSSSSSSSSGEMSRYRRELSRMRKKYYLETTAEDEATERRRLARARRERVSELPSKKLLDAVKRATAVREEARELARSIYSEEDGGAVREERRAESRENAMKQRAITDALRRMAVRSLNEESKSWIVDEETLRKRIREALERPEPMTTARK